MAESRNGRHDEDTMTMRAAKSDSEPCGLD